MLKEFKQFLQLKKLSKISVKNYLSDVRQFLTWTAKNSFKQLSPAVFSAYKSYLLGLKISAKSINRYLASLRSFGQFLKQQQLTATNPAQNLKNINLKSECKGPAYVKAGHLHQLDQFRQTLAQEKLKPATVKNYISDIRQFLNWLENKN